MFNQGLWLAIVIGFGCLVWPAKAQHTTVKVGVYHNPPKLFLAEDQITGIHGDLLREIAGHHNWALRYKSCQWQQCLQWLAQGKIDLLPDVAKTDNRQQRFFFHQEPALLSWSQLYAAQEETITSLLDLDGKRVAVLAESVQQTYLANIAKSFSIDVEFLQVDTFEQGFQALKRQRVDAVATNHFFGNQKVAEASAAITPIMFLPNELYFATGEKKNLPLLNAIDVSLNALKSDPNSVYYQILERWSAKPPSSELPAWTWWLMGILILVLLLSIIFIRVLNVAVKRRTQDLFDSEKKLETILDSVDAYIFIKGIDLSYQYVNHRVLDMFNAKLTDICGKTDYDLFDYKTAQQIADTDKEVLQTGRRIARHELNQVSGEDHQRAYWSVKVPLKNRAGKIIGLCGISTDISEYEELKQQIEKLAFFDVLTGLANRRMLLEKLSHHYQTNQLASALLLIDIDKFKTVNDTLGHEQGDELLRQVAARIESILEPTEIAGRLASDEFFILIEGLPAQEDERQTLVQQRLQQLQRALSTNYSLMDKQQAITFCYAVSFLGEVDNAEHLLKSVDLAMTQAKLVGSGIVQFYNSDLQQNFNRRQQLEAGLRAAIQGQHLTLCLQPQYARQSTDTGKDALRCIGFEALLRWYDVQLGHVSPGEFIPIAESAGLMPQLHSYVLNQVVEAISALQEHPDYRACSVAINVSASQFNHPKFYQELEQKLSDFKFAHHLELELTESVLVYDLEDVAQTMDKLTKLGLRFSLDDFGTGYSALGYLKRLPLKQLKIDQSFICDVLEDHNDEAIVATIIALAKSLNLSVLAEGVERQAQLEHLASMGCNCYQGFYLGHPQPLEYWLNQ